MKGTILVNPNLEGRSQGELWCSLPLEADLSIVGESIAQQPQQVQIAIPKQLVPGAPMQHVSIPKEEAHTRSSSLDIGTPYDVS